MNPPNGQTSLDYLNQIAPQSQKSGGPGLNFMTVAIGGVILIALVLILVAIVNAVGGGKNESWERLSARLTTASTVANSATTEIKSSQLRSLNSNLRIYLTNTQRDISTPLTTRGITTETMSADILAEESAEGITAALDDGRLNAKYDETYTREVGYLLATIVSLIEQMLKTDQAGDEQFLQDAHDNLVPIYEAIDSFGAVTTE